MDAWACLFYDEQEALRFLLGEEFGMVTLESWRDEVAYRAVDSTEIEPLHTPDHPFCDNPDCPCHGDPETFQLLVDLPYREGLLTNLEALSLFFGRQV